MRPFLLLALMLVTACAETRQSCERDVQREIGRLDDLIVDIRRDLARGYTYEQELRSSWPSYGTGLVFCSGGYDLRLCTSTGYRDRTVSQRVAIDPATEQRKLDNLEARRMRLAQQGPEACAAAYADG